MARRPSWSGLFSTFRCCCGAAEPLHLLENGPSGTSLVDSVICTATARSRRWAATAIVVAGLIVNFGLLLLFYAPSPKQLVGDESYYYTSASLIASGHRAPYNLIWPPLYVEFVGGLFTAFGERRITVQVVQIGLWLASGLLFSRMAERLTSSRFMGHVSLGLFLLSAELAAFSHYLWPETLHLFLWLLALWLLICHPHRRLAVAMAGLALGLALLTKSLLQPFIPVVTLFILIKNDSLWSVKRRSVNAALLLATLSLVVGPVMLHNLATRGEFIIADSSAFNIWVGLNDVGKTDHGADEIVGREFAEYTAPPFDHKAQDLVYQVKIVGKLEQQGLLPTLLKQLSKQYFRLFDIQTFFTTQLQGGGRAAYATHSQGLIRFLRLYSYVMYGWILVAGTAGICFVDLGRSKWYLFFVLFVIYNLGIFLLLHVKTRYVIQFLPMLIFFAGYTTHLLISKLGKARRPPPKGFVLTRARLTCALLLGSLVASVMVRSLF